jgi:hypothetical protein
MRLENLNIKAVNTNAKLGEIGSISNTLSGGMSMKQILESIVMRVQLDGNILTNVNIDGKRLLML